MSKKVLVLGEVREGSLRNVSFEAIAAAKQIADGGEVVGVLIRGCSSWSCGTMIRIRCRSCCNS